MTSNNGYKSTTNGRPLPASLGSGSNPANLLDKFNMRRSTPDSEVMASSDDEENHRQDTQQPVMPVQKPQRRASWLNDTSQPVVQPRKNSFASASMSPTASNPTTPSTESTAWNSHLPNTSAAGAGRGLSSSNFPWPATIWNNDTRKEPPSRLTEVLPSPTSAHVPGLGSSGNGYYQSDNIMPQSPLHRESTSNGTIPFAIPLHPTPKTYRSQSYSVGQLDLESGLPGLGASALPLFMGRGRVQQPPGLQHRPSRPSMLSEVSNDGMGLAKLKEVDGDEDEESSGSSTGLQVQSAEAKTIEYLARENALLRQQQQYQNARARPRGAANTGSFAATHGYGFTDPHIDSSDYAIDEVEEPNELNDLTHQRLLNRRLSEYGAISGPKLPLFGAVENRKLENVKKAYWQSSLGFAGLEDIPQSRRHSFADVPTRQGSVSSSGGEPLAAAVDTDVLSSKDIPGRYVDSTGQPYTDHGECALSRWSFPHPFFFPLIPLSHVVFYRTPLEAAFQGVRDPC
jgi:hypothetical protein